MVAPRPDAKGSRRLDRTARTTVVLLFAAWLIDYIDRLVINLALPAIGEEFDLSRTQQGMAVSAFFLAYALCQIPGGMLADRFGARRVTCWALLLWSAFTALTGLAGSFAMLLVVRFLFGAAEGVFPAASLKLVAERTSPDQRMGANGIVLSSNAVGAVIAPLVAAPLIAVFGWRSAFFSVAAAGVFVYAALRLWLPGRTEAAGPEDEAPETPGPGSARTVLGSGVMWRFAAMSFGYGLIIWGLTTWGPTYLSDELGIPLASVGALIALPAVAAAVATVVGGRVADRLEGGQRKVVVPAMTVSAIALLLMATSDSLAGFMIWITLSVFAASMCYMPIMAVPLRSMPTELTGAGAAMLILGAQVAGVTAPPVMGALADASGFGAAFAFLVTGAVIAAVMAALTPQTTPAFLAALHGRGGGPETDDTPALEGKIP